MSIEKETTKQPDTEGSLIRLYEQGKIEAEELRKRWEKISPILNPPLERQLAKIQFVNDLKKFISWFV